jgi:hypothetical protein
MFRREPEDRLAKPLFRIWQLSGRLIEIQGVPPGHEHFNIGRIKLRSSMTVI